MFRVLDSLATQHNWRLIAVACVVGIVTGLCAIGLIHRAMRSDAQARTTWLLIAGAATGFGLWATHFTAMLAFQPGMTLGFHVGPTALSLLAATAAACAGIAVALYSTARW